MNGSLTGQTMMRPVSPHHVTRRMWTIKSSSSCLNNCSTYSTKIHHCMLMWLFPMDMISPQCFGLTTWWHNVFMCRGEVWVGLRNEKFDYYGIVTAERILSIATMTVSFSNCSSPRTSISLLPQPSLCQLEVELRLIVLNTTLPICLQWQRSNGCSFNTRAYDYRKINLYMYT